ncbi:Uncharacterized protein FWK35_00031364 [Aphis craccivora]|uniref:Uncharacterized protein n=1 Tax=Aphis craccivora TaxID=307492 RepID=A0A6G0ZIX9_APHCR|nr:Uncharacterized protein FWK35_00031364 [Aphis craccivora]
MLVLLPLRHEPCGYRLQKVGRSPSDVIMFGIQIGGQTKAIPSDSRHNHRENRPAKGFLIVIKITPSGVYRPALLSHRNNVRDDILQSLLIIIRFNSINFHYPY